MIDKPDSPPPVEIIPSRAGEVSAIASANAPIIYFDGAPTFGFNEGIANVTLEVVRMKYTNGKVVSDRVTVAHLRMGLPAMMRLKAAIDGAILIANPVEKPEGKAN